MTSYAFDISFKALSARLKEMRKERPDCFGFINAKIRGHYSRIPIATARPNEELIKEFETTEAGVLILREKSCELVPYYDIFTLSAAIFDPKERV